MLMYSLVPALDGGMLLLQLHPADGYDEWGAVKDQMSLLKDTLCATYRQDRTEGQTGHTGHPKMLNGEIQDISNHIMCADSCGISDLCFRLHLQVILI